MVKVVFLMWDFFHKRGESNIVKIKRGRGGGVIVDDPPLSLYIKRTIGCQLLTTETAATIDNQFARMLFYDWR